MTSDPRPDVENPAAPEVGARALRWLRDGAGPFRWHPRLLLGLLVLVYVVVASVLSWVRALELQTTTWDMGVYQQAIWSASQGRSFYETPDVETGGFGSFLQVHSAFLLYLVVPLYAALPGQPVLLVFQSIVVGAAAFPLALFGETVAGSRRLGLLCGGVYLVWAPLLTANLYDFHAEAFLPVELFAFLYLWTKGRFRRGFLVVGVAFLTFELAPILLFFAGVYFLFPEGQTLRALLAQGRTQGVGPMVRDLARRVRVSLATTRTRLTLVLLVLCVGAYELLLYAREHLLSALLGVGAYPTGASGVGYVVGNSPLDLGLSLGALSTGPWTKVSCWLLALALLGFVPLLAPRAWILSLPWLAFTFLSTNLNYVTPGFQYGFILGCGLLPAFALGLPRLRRAWQRWTAGPRAGAPAAVPLALPSRRVWRRRAASQLPVLALALLVVANVAASPMDPDLQNRGLGSAYRLSYSIPPGFSQVVQLVDLLPPSATVVASDQLFPLVADDLNAYSFSWAQDASLVLPFNASHLPPFVLVSEDRLDAIPLWLVEALYTPSDYGVRGMVGASGAGVVLLFEAGYTGPTDQISPMPVPTGTYAGSEMGPGPDGELVPSTGTGPSPVLQGIPGGYGEIWDGPGVDLPAGTFRIVLWLDAAPAAAGDVVAPSTPVLFVDGNAFGQDQWFQENLTYGELAQGAAVPVSFSLSLGYPALEVYLRGYALSADAVVTLEYLQVLPS